MSVLDIHDLQKTYRKLRAVDDLHLKVEAGEFVGLIGPNGAGKSTLMNCAVGRIVPDAGEIRIGGEAVVDDAVGARMNVGFVPQELDLYGYLTGEEYLWFVGEIRGIAASELAASIDELLELTELSRARHRVVKEYSGGMARKLAIAGALVGRPPLLMLDESFVGLDPESTHALQNRLRRHCDEGGAIILSSHILDMLERICTRIVMMVEGKKVLDATMDEVKELMHLEGRETLTNLYLDRAGKA